MLSVFQSTAIKEVEDTLGTEDGISLIKKVEDGRYCTLQATGSVSQESAALDGQLDIASVCGRLSNFLGDTKAVPPLSVAEFAQEPTAQSGSPEQCQSYCSDGIEKEAKKKKSNRSGMCSDKAPGGIPGDLCRQDVCGPATRRSSKCTSASIAAQQSYNVSLVLEYGSSHDGTKGKKELPENPAILPPVKKKLRTFYNAEQLEELEKMFHEDHYPDNEKRKEIAAVVGVTPQRIMVTPVWVTVLTMRGFCLTSTLSLASCFSVLPLLPFPLLAPFNFQYDISSVAGMVTSCEAIQTKALPQLNFSSSRMECFPSLPSPPPIRRASLPLSLSFNSHSHIVPLMLDTPNSECCFSSQENGSREAFTYSIQNEGLTSPVPCNYPEELESADNLENTYCPYSSQDGIYQLPQYPQQHQLSQFHHLPAHLASNVLSSVHLSPTTATESHTAFLALPGNSGVVTHEASGATQAYVQSHTGGQLLLQQPSGNSGKFQNLLAFCSSGKGATANGIDVDSKKNRLPTAGLLQKPF
uniref:Homeobox domain-containing protein n=1 Tax=Strigops habroptila TaxID=2489341 RepID=A0A672TE37_STRHB